MRDAVDGKILGDGHFRRHDNIVGRSEHSVHAVGDECGGGGDDLVVCVRSLLDIRDSISVKICLRVRDGPCGVRLVKGVEQTDLGGVGVLGKHHIHDELGVERIACAGHIVDAGELRGLRVGDGGIDHGSFGVLGGEGGDLRGGGRNGNDGVHTVGNGLIGKLLERTRIALTGGHTVFDGHTVRGSEFVKLGGDGVCDLVERGVVELLDDGDLVGLAVRLFGRPIVLRAAGGEGQRHRTGKNEGKKLFHRVGFHFVFLRLV